MPMHQYQPPLGWQLEQQQCEQETDEDEEETRLIEEQKTIQLHPPQDSVSGKDDGKPKPEGDKTKTG